MKKIQTELEAELGLNRPEKTTESIDCLKYAYEGATLMYFPAFDSCIYRYKNSAGMVIANSNDERHTLAQAIDKVTKLKGYKE